MFRNLSSSYAHDATPKVDSFPSPNELVVKNIGKALLSNFQFYTQVLHLMNKMGLPCPFRESVGAEEENVAGEQKQSSESEIEFDDEEEDKTFKDKVTQAAAVLARLPVQRKRKILQTGICGQIKRKSREIANSKPQNNIREGSGASLTSKETAADISNFFEERKIPRVAKIVLDHVAKLPETVNTPKNEGDGQISGIFGTFNKYSVTRSPVPVKCETDSREIDIDLASDRLVRSSRRLPEHEMREAPVFRNYDRGTQCSTLYIKNIAKRTKETDLIALFSNLVVARSAEGNGFHIQLLTKGRMKGQAFATFPNPDIALKALEETNGMVLHGKPIVVVFAKAAVK